MDADSQIVHVKTDDVYKDIAKDVETRFDTSDFELERPLPKRKNKKIVGLMKNELGGQILKKFGGLRINYLKDKNDEDKKAKGTTKCVIKKLNLKIMKTFQKELNLRIK